MARSRAVARKSKKKHTADATIANASNDNDISQNHANHDSIQDRDQTRPDVHEPDDRLSTDTPPEMVGLWIIDREPSIVPPDSQAFPKKRELQTTEQGGSTSKRPRMSSNNNNKALVKQNQVILDDALDDNEDWMTPATKKFRQRLDVLSREYWRTDNKLKALEELYRRSGGNFVTEDQNGSFTVMDKNSVIARVQSFLQEASDSTLNEARLYKIDDMRRNYIVFGTEQWENSFPQSALDEYLTLPNSSRRRRFVKDFITANHAFKMVLQPVSDTHAYKYTVEEVKKKIKRHLDGYKNFQRKQNGGRLPPPAPSAQDGTSGKVSMEDHKSMTEEPLADRKTAPSETNKADRQDYNIIIDVLLNNMNKKKLNRGARRFLKPLRKLNDEYWRYDSEKRLSSLEGLYSKFIGKFVTQEQNGSFTVLDKDSAIPRIESCLYKMSELRIPELNGDRIFQLNKLRKKYMLYGSKEWEDCFSPSIVDHYSKFSKIDKDERRLFVEDMFNANESFALVLDPVSDTHGYKYTTEEVKETIKNWLDEYRAKQIQKNRAPVVTQPPLAQDDEVSMEEDRESLAADETEINQRQDDYKSFQIQQKGTQDSDEVSTEEDRESLAADEATTEINQRQDDSRSAEIQPKGTQVPGLPPLEADCSSNDISMEDHKSLTVSEEHSVTPEDKVILGVVLNDNVDSNPSTKKFRDWLHKLNKEYWRFDMVKRLAALERLYRRVGGKFVTEDKDGSFIALDKDSAISRIRSCLSEVSELQISTLDSKKIFRLDKLKNYILFGSKQWENCFQRSILDDYSKFSKAQKGERINFVENLYKANDSFAMVLDPVSDTHGYMYSPEGLKKAIKSTLDGYRNAQIQQKGAQVPGLPPLTQDCSSAQIATEDHKSVTSPIQEKNSTTTEQNGGRLAPQLPQDCTSGEVFMEDHKSMTDEPLADRKAASSEKNKAHSQENYVMLDVVLNDTVDLNLRTKRFRKRLDRLNKEYWRYDAEKRLSSLEGLYANFSGKFLTKEENGSFTVLDKDSAITRIQSCLNELSEFRMGQLNSDRILELNNLPENYILYDSKRWENCFLPSTMTEYLKFTNKQRNDRRRFVENMYNANDSFAMVLDQVSDTHFYRYSHEEAKEAIKYTLDTYRSQSIQERRLPFGGAQIYDSAKQPIRRPPVREKSPTTPELVASGEATVTVL